MSRKEVSMIGNLTRDMMRDVMETSLKKPIQTGEFRKNPVEPAWRCPNDYIYELIPTGKFVMEYLKPKQAVTGRVILQLHGGGYIGPMKNIYRRFAVKYSELGFGADVLTPDYRVAPEHPFPAALEDAVYAYKWLLNEKNTIRNRSWLPEIPREADLPSRSVSTQRIMRFRSRLGSSRCPLGRM